MKGEAIRGMLINQPDLVWGSDSGSLRDCHGGLDVRVARCFVQVSVRDGDGDGGRFSQGQRV